jgi:hypothetical protein
MDLPPWIDTEKRYPDAKAPDGIAADGWRQIRKGGRIKWRNSYWYHAELEPFTGCFVKVGNGDYWNQELEASKGDWFLKLKKLD